MVQKINSLKIKLMKPKGYFSQSDFNRCIPACRKNQMHPETMSKLTLARHMAGIPFIPTSAYRSPEYEKSMGRPGTSAHTNGRAIDLACVTSAHRKKMVEALLDAGFNRIGIASTFIHVDDDPTKPPNLIWTY
jgi:zinc D-Ala-D-Ala carboxypeptidase